MFFSVGLLQVVELFPAAPSGMEQREGVWDVVSYVIEVLL
jgi:hypothetical protein